VMTDDAGPRPLEPVQLTEVLAEIEKERDIGGGFDVVVWVGHQPLDADRLRAWAEAGATWLLASPEVGEHWVDESKALAAAGPPGC
jgi:hypothetical protein